MPPTPDDQRPAVWVGHVVLPTPDIAKAKTFYTELGMRDIFTNDQVVVLELRGGTHMVLTPGEAPEAAPFDLMVDDIDVAHGEYAGLGFEPTTIERGDIHDRFTIADPAGCVVTINSSHVAGLV